MAMVMLT